MTFDLEAARAGIAHYRIENHSNVDTESAIKELVDQANLAEDAVAEIERLTVEHQNALDEVKNLEEQNLLRKQENERLLEALDESEKIVAHKTKSAAHWYDEFLQARADLAQCKIRSRGAK